MNIKKITKHNASLKIDGAQIGFQMPVVLHQEDLFSETEKHLVAEKSPLKSKTMWFNLLATLLTVVATFLPELQSYMSSGAYLALVMVVTFGNKAIRLVTRSPLRMRNTNNVATESDYFGEHHYDQDASLNKGDLNG